MRLFSPDTAMSLFDPSLGVGYLQNYVLFYHFNNDYLESILNSMLQCSGLQGRYSQFKKQPMLSRIFNDDRIKVIMKVTVFCDVTP
jgi:hypothetical protein